MSGWAGRRLHFIGIGGAGMSGLALVCRQLGAEVSGSDRADSSYMERLRAAGIEPAVGHDTANLPEGAEAIVSTAIDEENPELTLARERGLAVRHRGELLAELCAEKRLIAIAGTHGKTTTTAMLAWALREIGAEPAFFVGGEVPGLGPSGAVANAGWGEGEWVVAEADESDASFLELAPEIAVITNIEMDHHSRWGSIGELRAAFTEFAASANACVLPADDPTCIEPAVGARCRADGGFDAGSPGPARLSLAVPGRHNLLNARAALAAAELAGFDLDAVAAALVGFPGVHRRLELKGERDGTRVYDDYAHHPTEVRAALEALRGMAPTRLIAAFQPHLYSRTRALAEQFGAALALADEVVVLDVYAAREEPVGDLAGVSGLDVARAAADRMGGRRVLWAPTLEQARAALESRLGPGAVLATIGAGDVYRVGEALIRNGGRGMSVPPAGVERDFPLARLTTVRTGGGADWFAQPETEGALLRLLAWADEENLPIGVVGSGSNLLVADEGFRGLVLKLSGDLATIQPHDHQLYCGGGVRLPAAATRAANLGLSGLEFGVNIPGTVGGAVRMNANAYGGQLAEVLEWVGIASAAGLSKRTPEQLDFGYRSSNLADGEIVARASFRLVAGDPKAIKATMAGMRERRHEAQPSGVKTFGSTFKNPEDERAGGRTAGQLLEAAGCRGLEVGGVRFSTKHANFVENVEGGTTADVLGLMAAGRRRVHERFGVALEPEVQLLGDVRWPEDWRL
jgi:UDP-N-acetylmuramate--alanine ligase